MSEIKNVNVDNSIVTEFFASNSLYTIEFEQYRNFSYHFCQECIKKGWSLRQTARLSRGIC